MGSVYARKTGAGPLLYAVMFFLAGVLFPFPARFGGPTGLVAGLSAVLLAMFFLKDTRVFYAAFFLFFFLLGCFRQTVFHTPVRDGLISFPDGTSKRTVVQCIVISEPELKTRPRAEYAVFNARVIRAMTDGEEAPSRSVVRITYPGTRRLPFIGDEIVISGEIFPLPHVRNPYTFDYGEYLRNKGVDAVMRSDNGDIFSVVRRGRGIRNKLLRHIFSFRRHCIVVIKARLSARDASFVNSVITGDRGDIPLRLRDTLIRSGIAHIIAISGLHVGIMAFVATGMARAVRLGRVPAYIVGMISVWVFVVMSGARPSALRAAIMISLFMAGRCMGRDPSIPNILGLSAFIIVFLCPGAIRDPGFLLSYAAVISIVYITPLTDKAFGLIPVRGKKTVFRRNRMERFLFASGKYLSVSLAVWLGMAPLTGKYFNIVSPGALVCNLVAIPVLMFSMASGVLLIVSGSLGSLSLLTGPVSFFTDKTLNVFFGMLSRLNDIPLAFVRVRAPHVYLVLPVYICVILILIRSYHRSRGAIFYLLLIVLLIANMFVWNELASRPVKDLKITFFDVGKADASVIEFPDGGTMLIDAGYGDEYSDAGYGVIAPYLWARGIRRLDCVVLTHYHADHAGGMPYILENFRIGVFLEGDTGAGRSVKDMLRQRISLALKGEHIPRGKVKEGDVLSGFEGTEIKVLNPGTDGPYQDENGSSVVLKLDMDDGTGALFCADAGREAILNILRFGNILRSDIIKAPHHGSGTCGEDVIGSLLDITCPSWGIITNVPGNRCGYDIFERLLEEHNAEVFVTGETGAAIAQKTVKKRTFIVRSAGR